MPESEVQVLLADDDPAMLRLLAKWLESAGYRVRCARDGYEAMAAIDEECPQFLVTDWEMPEMDGLELCRWLRGRDLPCYVYTIILTVRSGSHDMVRGLESGADDFLKKPVDRGELLARMRAGIRVLELESRLSLLARSDPLTGLPTQRTLFEQGNREWQRAKRYHFPISCAMIDIDFFKRVNDTYGHAVGDEVIRRVAKVLADNCRASDLISRYGGEEFCALLPETSEKNAALWAERVREVIAATDVSVDRNSVRVTISVGVSQMLDDIESMEALVDMADQALLVAKQSGRDRVVAYQSIGQFAQLRLAAKSPGLLFSGLPARSVMTHTVASLRQNDPVGRAARYFLRYRFNAAPVVDDDGKLVGILAEKDVMAIMLWPNWWATRISDIMKRNVVAYDEETPVLSIYEFLCRVAIRSVVIVNDGRPTGMISRGSLLRWFVNSLSYDRSSTEEAAPACDISLPPPRQRLAATARSLADAAAHLELDLCNDEVDVVPCVVGGASRLQELTNDLLAYSRYADNTTED
jgi:diguanylate cyclase (GGDEF)-like protein